MINGFDFDPMEEGDDNPHRTLFRIWSERIHERTGDQWKCFDFGWYSAELEPGSWTGSLIRGHWNPYRWGWELAGTAGGVLAKTIEEATESSEREICMIAHSMGARVALKALCQLPRSSVKRVLLLNGSEYSQTAKAIADYTDADVLNIVVRADDVLDKLGSVFAPEAFIRNVVGQSGLIDPPGNWLDFFLDKKSFQESAAAHGLKELRGDNPVRMADHWYSYTHEPDWNLFGKFIDGEIDLRRAREIAGLRNGGAATA